LQQEEIAEWEGRAALRGTASATFFQRTLQGGSMPQGDKSKYTDKQKRKAEHIEEGYEERGVPPEEAERRAWATVNKIHGGGEKPGGGGYGKPENHEPSRKGGRKSGKSRS
jgi:plasmid stabilization system protein ParE